MTAPGAGQTDRHRGVEAAPYAWPWDGVLDPDRLALVVAGCDRGWQRRCATGATNAQLDLVTGVIHERHATVITVHHEAAGPTGRPGDLGPEPDGYWRPPVPALEVTAFGIDGFFASALDHVLRARHLDHLVLAGFGLEGPVHSTLRSANDRGYECLLLTDAAAPLQPDLVTAAISTVTMSGGIFGAVATTSAFLDGFAPTLSKEALP